MILQGVWRDDPRLVPTIVGVRTVQVRTREWVESSNPLLRLRYSLGADMRTSLGSRPYCR